MVTFSSSWMTRPYRMSAFSALSTPHDFLNSRSDSWIDERVTREALFFVRRNAQPVLDIFVHDKSCLIVKLNRDVESNTTRCRVLYRQFPSPLDEDAIDFHYPRVDFFYEESGRVDFVVLLGDTKSFHRL